MTDERSTKAIREALRLLPASVPLSVKGKALDGLATLLKRNEEQEKQIAVMRELLRRLEWIHHNTGMAAYTECHICGGMDEDHEEGCDLVSALTPDTGERADGIDKLLALTVETRQLLKALNLVPVDVVYAEEQLDSVRWIQGEHERLTPTQDERLMGLEKWLAALIGEAE